MTEPTPFAWLQHSSVQTLFAALGYPAVDVRFVGGCVRDSLVGRAIGDLDVATPTPPSDVIAQLTAAGIKVIATGLAHGTVTALLEGRSFEITTLRRDTACDGRHAVVEFTHDWREDASRRDFTMNALSLKLSGEVVDYFSGCEDLKAGCVKFVGVAADRIQEDYLRILRLFRFQAHFGKSPIEPESLQACAKFKDKLHTLSLERITHEVLKLLSAPDPLGSVRAMEKSGVLSTLLPEAKHVETLAKLIDVENRYALSPAPLRRLASLAKDEDVDALVQHLRLSNQQERELEVLLDNPGADAANIGAALYYRGRDVTLHRLALCAASGLVNDCADLIVSALAWQPKPLPIGGDALLAAGMQAGPAIGQALKRAEKLWIESGFKSPVADLLAIALKS